MLGLSRRAFFGASVGGLSVFHAQHRALAALPSDAIGLSHSANICRASALNLKLFLENQAALGLAGLLSVRPAQGDLGHYDSGALFLFPFKLGASSPDLRAFLPGRGLAQPIIATPAMMPGGLPPDDYFCTFVLKAPRESFISFSAGMPFVNGAQNRPWHSNVDNIGGGSIGIGWTSSNFNHPWFAGSHWIPDHGEGKYWRARIIADMHRLALAEVSPFGGAVG